MRLLILAIKSGICKTEFAIGSFPCASWAGLRCSHAAHAQNSTIDKLYTWIFGDHHVDHAWFGLCIQKCPLDQIYQLRWYELAITRETQFHEFCSGVKSGPYGIDLTGMQPQLLMSPSGNVRSPNKEIGCVAKTINHQLQLFLHRISRIKPKIGG